MEEKAVETILQSKMVEWPYHLPEPARFMLHRLSLQIGLPLILFGITLPNPLWAAELADIQPILDDPRVYHLRHVTLQGTVRDVHSLAPYKLPNETVCYGAYLFRLENGDATIPVAVLGICGSPIVRDPEVEDGDRVEVSATIQAPSHGGHYLSFRGPQAVTEQEEGIVQAIADRILPIIE